MEKVWEAIKKIGIVVATALSAVALVLLGKESWRRKTPENDVSKKQQSSPTSFGVSMPEEKIEGKCNEKRNEALERLSNTDARKLSENYGGVCDAITDGKLRFRKRCEDATRRELD